MSNTHSEDRDDVRGLDPDRADVPAELQALADKGFTDTDGVPTGLAIVPSFFGHSRRLREGFFDDRDGDR